MPLILSRHYDESCSNEVSNPHLLALCRDLRRYDRYMFTLWWCDCPNGLSASRHLSPLICHIQSVSDFFPHTHVLSFHRTLSLSAPLSISLWFLPSIASASAFHFFFDLQELFDLLTDLFYLRDLATSFQQDLCGGIDGVLGGGLLSPQSARKKKPLGLYQLAWALRSIITPTVSRQTQKHTAHSSPWMWLR